MGERALEVSGARLHVREAGQGDPLVIVHGGPDFDHAYLLPEMDGLADAFRLVYYDQRGRGRSSGEAADVTIESEVADLDAIRVHLGVERVAVLGHSWGALLALEYATRWPERTSALVLMNPAPASHADLQAWRAQRQATHGRVLEEMGRIAETAAYASGDIEADISCYRLHFGSVLERQDQLETLLSRLRQHFTPRDVVRARAVEERLHEQTWDQPGYDLVPKLAAHPVPTLVIHGARDFFPVEGPERVAQAAGGRLVVLAGCGHFAYFERTAETITAIRDFLDERAASLASA